MCQLSLISTTRESTPAVLQLSHQSFHLRRYVISPALISLAQAHPQLMSLELTPLCYLVKGVVYILPSAVACEGLGQLFPSHTFWALLTHAFPSGPTPLCCQGEFQGSLCADAVKGRANSPALIATKPLTSGDEKQEGMPPTSRIHHSSGVADPAHTVGQVHLWPHH